MMKHWTTTIYPDFYDDADDHGYMWAGPARNAEHAVERACRACERDNRLSRGALKASDIDSTDTHVDPEWLLMRLQVAVEDYLDTSTIVGLTSLREILAMTREPRF